MWVIQRVQKKLLSEADLTLAKAVNLAKNFEAASKSAQTLKGTPDLAIGLMKHEKSGPLVEGKACHQCGQPSHFASRCSFRDAICHNCGKRGHLARVCMSGKQKPFKGPRRRQMWWMQTPQER